MPEDKISLSQLKGSISKPLDKIPITNQHRKDWNDYVAWLGTKNLRGNPVLDKGGYGNQVLLEYIKQNPKTSLTPELVTPIQSDFSNYRNYALGQIKAGKGQFAPGVDENNFMTELSKLDNYPGSLTTKHYFPQEYIATYDKPTNTTTTQKIGYATVNK